MTFEYSELDAKFTLAWYRLLPPPDLMECDWWTPDGIMPIIEWSLTQCPYYIKCVTGEIRHGAFGPGTCMGGCVDEPRCMT